jgi:hypothetical protein
MRNDCILTVAKSVSGCVCSEREIRKEIKGNVGKLTSYFFLVEDEYIEQKVTVNRTETICV